MQQIIFDSLFLIQYTKAIIVVQRKIKERIMVNDYMNQFTENMKKFTQNAFNPVSDFQKVTTEVVQDYTRKNIEAFTSTFSSTNQKMQELAEIKKAEDFAKFCTDCTKEASETALKLTKEALDNSIKVSKKYAEIAEKSFKNSATV